MHSFFSYMVNTHLFGEHEKRVMVDLEQCEFELHGSSYIWIFSH